MVCGTGRVPNLENLNLEGIGVGVTEKGIQDAVVYRHPQLRQPAGDADRSKSRHHTGNRCRWAVGILQLWFLSHRK